MESIWERVKADLAREEAGEIPPAPPVPRSNAEGALVLVGYHWAKGKPPEEAAPAEAPAEPASSEEGPVGTVPPPSAEEAAVICQLCGRPLPEPDLIHLLDDAHETHSFCGPCLLASASLWGVVSAAHRFLDNLVTPEEEDE